MNSSRPLRALFVVPELPFGGAERHVATLVPRLDPARFVASVLSIGVEGELFAELTAAGVSAEALHLGGQRNAARAFRGLVSHMRRTRPDVVIVRGYNAEVLGCAAALVAGVKHRVVWVHDIGDIKPRTAVRNLAMRVLMPSISSHFGVAEAQKPHIINGLHCPADKVRIIHNGVDPALFSAVHDRTPLAEFDIQPDESVVGIVAALRPEKDHGTLLRAASILLADLPKTKILVIGDGPTRASLEALSRDLGIAHNVCFAGGRSDVARLLQALDVVVLCSVTECFPLSVLEAMACGRPVVCSDVGGIGEMVEHGVNGYLVPPRTPEQLSARLKDLLVDPDLAHRMGQAGRRRVESDFTLDRSVDVAQRAMEEVAGRR